MDIRAEILALVLLVSCCICVHAQSPSRQDAEEYEQMENGQKLLWLEKQLRDDIARELEDIHSFEQQLQNSLNSVQLKKRQLEIKKRQPVQCLVNIVSCWKRK